MRFLPLTAIALAGCVTSAPPPATTVGNTYLVCGSAVRLDISHDGRSAVLREGQREGVVLTRADSPLGTRYGGSGLAIIRSGDTYIYLDGTGASLACDPITR